MKDLIKQNYEVTKARGLITNKTTPLEFKDKLIEEVLEVIRAENNRDIGLELADVIYVCGAYAINKNIDLDKYMKEKIEINRKRIPKINK